MRDCSNNWNERWPNLEDSRNIVETFSNVNNLERETEREKERLCKKIQKILPLSRRYNYYPRRVRDCWNNWNGRWPNLGDGKYLKIVEGRTAWSRFNHCVSTTVFPHSRPKGRRENGTDDTDHRDAENS